jgi:glycosyltransferase involved in cell wall biosynthesis
MSIPKVSVIVPNYNHAQYLNQRIDSILSQTYQDFELILLDDCSTDNSREVLNQYKGNKKVTHLVFNETNGGSTFKQWNKGIELAKGEYIWIAESDDYTENTFLETIIAEFEKRPNVGLIYTTLKTVDSSGNVILDNTIQDWNNGNVIEYKGVDFVKKQLSMDVQIWNASTMIFRKSIYPNSEQQLLYSKMRYCGDWFFYVLLAEKMDVLKINKSLCYFRRHSQNVSTKADASGLTFIEGLEVYAYIKRKLTRMQGLIVSLNWVQKYNTHIHRHQLSNETKQKIVTIFHANHKDIFILNKIFFFDSSMNVLQKIKKILLKLFWK